MRKSIMMALCMAMLVFAASCGNKKAETTAEPAKVEVEVITDSAFQQKAAGDYASLDQKTVITLNSDFTVTTKNYKKNYYKWEFMVQPQGSEANIMLASKGMDTDIKDQAIIDVEEGKIVVNNETFRKAAK